MQQENTEKDRSAGGHIGQLALLYAVHREVLHTQSHGPGLVPQHHQAVSTSSMTESTHACI